MTEHIKTGKPRVNERSHIDITCTCVDLYFINFFDITEWPQWRNGLKCWTSNSKVVGSSPTGGEFFEISFQRLKKTQQWLTFDLRFDFVNVNLQANQYNELHMKNLLRDQSDHWKVLYTLFVNDLNFVIDQRHFSTSKWLHWRCYLNFYLFSLSVPRGCTLFYLLLFSCTENKTRSIQEFKILPSTLFGINTEPNVANGVYETKLYIYFPPRT